MADLLFDKLTYIDKLKEAGVTEQQARGHAEALDLALRDGVATHGDLIAVRTEIAAVRTEIVLAVRDMTIRMGAIAVALFAALASIKFFT